MKNWIILLLFSSTFLHCAKTIESSKTCTCPENQPCTMIYSMINVQIVNVSNQPIILTEYRTIKIATNEILHEQKGIDSTNLFEAGKYLIVDDGDLSKIAICGEEVQFIGFKNAKQIVNEKFTVKNNCCHVEVLKGNTKIILP